MQKRITHEETQGDRLVKYFSHQTQNREMKRGW